MTSAILFDAFGTVIDIKRRLHPYRMLLRLGMQQGLRFGPDALRQLMVFNGSMIGAADLLGVRVFAQELEVIQEALDEELASCVPFPDAVEAIDMLRAAGIRTGICSNLAQAYGPTLRRHFPTVDGFALSYECEVMKPDPLIYQMLCRSLGVTPMRDWHRSVSSVLMIGDSPRCDRDGPRSVGIPGYLLRRNSRGPFGDLVQFATTVLASIKS